MFCNDVPGAFFDNTGSIILTITPPPSENGDAYYHAYNVGAAQYYTGTDGLTVDGAKPAVTPAYSVNHVYTSLFTGTGSPFTFQFGDSVDYTDNSATNLTVKVTGPGMAYP